MSIRNRRSLPPWFSGALFVGLFGIAAACASGSQGDDQTDPAAEGEGGAAGDDGTAGDGGEGGGSTTGGSGGSKAGSGGSGASTQGGGGSKLDGGFPEGSSTGGSSGSSGSAGSGTAGSGGSSGSTSTGGSGGTGGTPAMGELGAPCTNTDQCKSKQCVDVGHASSPAQVCVEACETGMKCPAGFHCATLDGPGPSCIPDRDSLCGVCSVDSDCKNQGDRCLTNSTGEKYCAQDCSFDGVCPASYECKAPMGAPAGVKVCQSPAGSGCPCAPNRDKQTRTCTKMSNGLTCSGTETCDASMGKYVGCTAGDPMPETCNMKDDDCDGKVDNLPGATCNCNGQGCTIQCMQGYSKYPIDLPDSAGCPCAIDTGEPQMGGTCAAPLSLSKMADVGGKMSTEVTGTLSSDDDVDWYKVDIADTPEMGTDSMHVRITFSSNTDGEFALKVLRGADCARETMVPQITSYDFCVNFQSDDKKIGLASCGETDGLPHCEDKSQPYAFAVMRSTSAKKKTCTPYKVKIETAAGPCDKASFDNNCMEPPPPAPM